MEVKLPKKSEDVNEWYNQIVEAAGLCDKRYPIQGCNVWTPYGWKAMQNIDKYIREEMERTHHEEVNFPLLIPESLFAKEAEHIKGFGGEVYWVTHAGNNELSERLLLRPTSETAMYPMFALWVRSHADLPLKVFQLVNTFRYETKQTRAFIRIREIHFFEAHTCHVDFEDAERQIKEDLEIVKRLFKRLALPYVMNKRPEWDKFAGAFYSIGLDVLMPSGKSLQLGSVHQYKTNFSEPYEIKYEAPDGSHKFAHQTTYGMSERLLGAIVLMHGDDKGLVLPPDVAPIQIVMVPIIFKGKEQKVLEACKKVLESLESKGLRVRLDDRELTPGNKYYEWELKGVPLRIEIGPRDVDGGKMVLVRRDTGSKNLVGLGDADAVRNELEAVRKALWKKAEDVMANKNIAVKTLDEAKALRASGYEGMIRTPWCGADGCGHEAEAALEMKTLGTPAEGEKPGEGARCAVCGAPAKEIIVMARSY